MGMYFGTALQRKAWNARMKVVADREAMKIETGRRQLAAKIVMAITDKVITEIIRPGPVPEERECYEVAGEIRAVVPELEDLAVKIINVNDDDMD